MSDQGSAVLTTVVQKAENETSFGFGISQPAGSPHLIVKNVVANSPAARGGLQIGDFLLAIDSESLFGKTVKDVAALISKAQNGRLTVAYTRGGDSNKENVSLSGTLQPDATMQSIRSTQGQPTPTLSGQPDPIFMHHLVKWKSYPGFGFSIHQKPDGLKAIVKVEPNAPAFASGLKADSILCQVNATNVQNLPYPDTVALIKASGAEVKVTVTSQATLQWLASSGRSLHEVMGQLQVITVEPPPEPPLSEPPAQIADPVSLNNTMNSIGQPVMSSFNSSINASLPDYTGIQVFRSKLSKTATDKGYGFALKFEAGQNGLPGYLKISRVDDNSPAYLAGLQAGMIIVAVNGQSAFDKTVADIKPAISVHPNDVEFSVTTEESFMVAVAKFGANLPAAANNFPVSDLPKRNSAGSPAPTSLSGTLQSSGSALGQSIPRSTAMPEESTWPDTLPVPRVCSLSKWPTKFKGYGFHLQAERNRPGHYIGKLDPGSPAEQGGLILNWRIIAVNGASVLNEPHQIVVQTIQASGDTVQMLIASSEAVAFCEQRGIPISGSMAVCKVQHFQTPLSPPDDMKTLSPGAQLEQTSPIMMNQSLSPQSVEQLTPRVDVTPDRPSTTSQNQSPAPPTPPSPLPFSPISDQFQSNKSSNEDADLAYLKMMRDAVGTRRARDARRQPNRDIKQAFELANGL